MNLTVIAHPDLSLVELHDAATNRTVAEYTTGDALDLADHIRDAAHTTDDPQALAAATGRYGTRTA